MLTIIVESAIINLAMYAWMKHKEKQEQDDFTDDWDM